MEKHETAGHAELEKEIETVTQQFEDVSTFVVGGIFGYFISFILFSQVFAGKCVYYNFKREGLEKNFFNLMLFTCHISTTSKVVEFLLLLAWILGFTSFCWN